MRRRIASVLVLIGLLGAGLFYIIQRSNRTAFGSFRKYNVLLISIDTLRADHLPAYGYTRIRTPQIDRLGNESLIFEDAVAQAPMTLPSHASILTGLLPIAHGVRDNAGFILDPKATTLVEILKSKGYQTAGFVSAFVLDSQFGLDQGFDHYSDEFTLTRPRVVSSDIYRRASETEEEVETWLDHHHANPFFVWVHYYDPHDPYDPPEPYRKEYASSPYDGEIAYTDHVLGSLLDHLEQLQLKEKTIIVFTGDHGEGLGEHNERTHSLFIYNTTQHVPLLIRLPKGKSRRIPGVVSHIDIAPTLLEWLGISPEPQMQGRSLIPLIQGKETPGRVAFSESIFAQLHYGWSPLTSLATGEYRFIDAPTPELYDRIKDRGETVNLMKERPDIANALRKQLDEIRKTSPKTEGAAPAKMDPETEEKLKALGYVGTIVPSTPESRKIDPKDRTHLLEALTQVSTAMENKDYRYVVETANRVLEQDPNIVDAHFFAASGYLHLGEKEKALAEMNKTIRLKPDHTQTLYNLAFFYQIQGKLPEAEHWYLQLLKYEPAHLIANMNLVSLYRQMNQPQKGQPYLSRIVHSYEKALVTATGAETRSSLLEKLAEISYKTGDLTRSEQLIRQAIQLTPRRPTLHFHLGVIYEAKKEFDAAASEYEEETSIDPNNPNAFLSLGMLHRKSGRLQDAIACFRRVIQINKQFYPAYYRLAEAYLAAGTNLHDALRLVETAEGHTPSKQGETLLVAIREKMKR